MAVALATVGIKSRLPCGLSVPLIVIWRFSAGGTCLEFRACFHLTPTKRRFVTINLENEPW